MREPLVFVLVINWNGREHLEACFDSLLAMDYPNAKFVLVDNASTDDSVAFAEARYGTDDRFVVLPCDENLGWGGGNNAGIEAAVAAGADYVLLLNNDTATAPDAVSALVAQAEAHPDSGSLAPKMLMFDQPDVLNSIGIECSLTGSSWDRGIGRIDGAPWDEVVETLAACGGAAFYRVSALLEVGVIDATFGIYFDDVDLGLRLWNGGFKSLTCPAARVRHKFSASFRSEAGRRHKYYLGTRNRMRLVMRNFPMEHLGAWLPRLLLGEVKAVGRALQEGAGWQVAAHARAWWDALRYLPEARRERAGRAAAGFGACRFWRMMNREHLFCPAVVLPVDGWYGEGERDRPLARRAWRDWPGGRLRISLANCYSSIDALVVTVSLDDGVLTELDTTGQGTFEGMAPAGKLTFEARTILRMEETGLPFDCGGWVTVEAL